MPEVLFPNFLKDKDEYLKSRAFWKDQFDQLAEKHGFTYTSYLNDEPLEFDGNPIFNAWVPEIGRGVRIIQVEAGVEGPELSAWLDSVEIGDGVVVEELVVDIKLSSDSLTNLLELLENWLPVKLSRSEIEKHLLSLQN